MEKQTTLFKGELMEELLRSYFLEMGYYVVRSAKFKFQGIDLTDIDLYLYKRGSSVTRERINVDIKNKKVPQAFERILWANGIMKLLGFDSCVVATKDTRQVIHLFGKKHRTTILDGIFLARLSKSEKYNRLVEEEFLQELAKHVSYKHFGNKDWRDPYEQSKSRLLNEQDFSGLNSTLSSLSHFVEIVVTEDRNMEIAVRMIYAIMSHLLVIMDFILKDIAFLEPKEREKVLVEGLTFGNLGREGVGKIISIATQISGNRSADSYLTSLRNLSTEIFSSFFVKNENANATFNWAREFESLAFSKTFAKPDGLEAPLKSVLGLILDHSEVERKTFFQKFNDATNVKASKLTSFIIVRATYGTSRNSVDVTELISQQVKGNRLELVADNGIAGDPDPGVVKTLKLMISKDGVLKEYEFVEGDKISIG